MAELASQGLDEDQSLRLQDYLDDKLQTSTDLENLDALLENVSNQQTLLKQQVGLFPGLLWILISSVASSKRLRQLSLKQPRRRMLMRPVCYNKQRSSESSRAILTAVCLLLRDLRPVTMPYKSSIQVWITYDD